jgi:hypothetical protein
LRLSLTIKRNGGAYSCATSVRWATLFLAAFPSVAALSSFLPTSTPVVGAMVSLSTVQFRIAMGRGIFYMQGRQNRKSKVNRNMINHF